MGLCSVMVPVGSILGGGALIVLKSFVNRVGRGPVVCIGLFNSLLVLLLLNLVLSFISGLLLHSIAFLGCLLFLPHPAPLGDTPEEAFLEPRFSISFPFALCCSFSITSKRQNLISHPVTGLRFWLWFPCCLAQAMLVLTLRQTNKINKDDFIPWAQTYRRDIFRITFQI